MPNWVTNYLTIKIKDIDLVADKDGNVDFNRLIPMPMELENTISGGDIEDCMAYQYLNTHTKKEFVESKYFRKNYAKLTKSMEKNKMLSKLLSRIRENPKCFESEFYNKSDYNHTPESVGQYYLDLEQKYGYINWYDWSIANWGCKWNASSCDEIHTTEDTVCFMFSTPWGTPNVWLEKLAENIHFHLAWEEEQGYRGIITSFGCGIEIDEDLPMLEWEETDDGCYEHVKDEYGDEWYELYLDSVF